MPPREIRGLGYEGSYVTVASYVRPRRRARQPQATVRFETASGEQAQLDWGNFTYIGDNWRQHRVWAFVMVLSWSRSRSLYVEFVRRADTASFIQCHVNAFEYFGGVPRRWLYDNAKVVTLGRYERVALSGTGGCWTSRSERASRCACASPIDLRPRGRWRAG